jgi:hypothetical protein
MSFKAFFSYFVGVIAMLIGSKAYIQSKSAFMLVLLLIGGFCISQITSFVVHMYCKTKNEMEHPSIPAPDYNSGNSGSRVIRISAR